MENELSALLRTTEGLPVPLSRVDIKVALRDLICVTEVIQEYENNENTNIEAAYTFPLPAGAVLLELELELGKRTLRGVVIERTQAEERYEGAITDGNTAVLLQEVREGLFTMNVGNLMGGDKARIRLRYAMLLAWTGDLLRLSIPTALAPRYGQPADFEPHQAPGHDSLAEYPLSVELTLEGPLADAKVECPSHATSDERLSERRLVRLANDAMLDRDCVFTIQASEAGFSPGSVYRDGDGCIAIASIRPALTGSSEVEARSVKIVVDCSGSMAGDSVSQARLALTEILGLLQPTDEFNIIAFGSSQKVLFRDQQFADKNALARGFGFIDALDADMGGTELEGALRKTFALRGRHEAHDVLLITDGAVWNHEAIVQDAISTRHRVFVVGVGSAVAEDVVRRLAESTGGACELVTPRENMAAGIVRQFRRIYQPPMTAMQVTWPGVPVWQSPLGPSRAFAGDTLHLLAGFAIPVEGHVTVDMSFSGDVSMSQSVALIVANAESTAAETAARLAAAQRIKELEPGEALATALQYQLISPYTCYLAVADRDDKAAQLPELRIVPQMVAAGWGGLGSVAAGQQTEFYQDMPVFSRDTSSTVLSRTVFSRAGQRGPITPAEFAKRLNEHFKGLFTRTPCPSALIELEIAGLPTEITAALEQLVDTGWNEGLVVIGFLQEFSQRMGRRFLSRNALRAIAKAAKAASLTKALSAHFRHCMQKLSGDDWAWQEPASAPYFESASSG